jgi:hypothetical protein
MWYGVQIGPFIIGGGRSGREDAEAEAWEDLTPIEAGGFALAVGLAVLIAAGTTLWVIAAWIAQHGGVEALVTALWFIVGIPLAIFVLSSLGKWAQRHF